MFSNHHNLLSFVSNKVIYMQLRHHFLCSHFSFFLPSCCIQLRRLFPQKKKSQFSCCTQTRSGRGSAQQWITDQSLSSAGRQVGFGLISPKLLQKQTFYSVLEKTFQLTVTSLTADVHWKSQNNSFGVIFPVNMINVTAFGSFIDSVFGWQRETNLIFDVKFEKFLSSLFCISSDQPTGGASAFGFALRLKSIPCRLCRQCL